MGVLKGRMAVVMLSALFCAQVAFFPSATYAAYAVQDDVVRDNTKDILKQSEGIHEDTKSIDKTSKSILEYVTRIWRQGEQEARSFEDSEGSNEDGGLNSLVSVGGLESSLRQIVSGSGVDAGEVMRPMKTKDSVLVGKLHSVLTAFGNGGWSSVKSVLQNELTTELQKLTKVTKSDDVFPELAQADLDELLKNQNSKPFDEKMDTFFKDKFPTIVQKVVDKKDPSAIRQLESEALGMIYNNISKSRKKTTAARLAMMAKMDESHKRVENYMKLLPYAQGSKQVEQLMAKIAAEQILMESYKARADMNQQQQESLEAEARDQKEINERAAQDAVAKASMANMTYSDMEAAANFDMKCSPYSSSN